MESNKIDVSIIVPALNEEKNIFASVTNVLESFKDFKLKGEVIVINDGSTDKTREIVEDFIKKDKRIRIINHEISQGIGASFWDGVDNAKGDVVSMFPGDNENDPWEILRYYQLLEHVDIVIPFVFNKEVRSLFRNALSFIYRFIINTTFLVNINYTNGTVLYRKSILKELDYRNKGFFFQTDIVIRQVKKGYLFAEVPYKLGARKKGVSKAVTFPSFFQVVKGYIRLGKEMYHKRNRSENKDFSVDTLTAKRYKKNDK